MARPRERIDHCLCAYVLNAVISMGPGRAWLNRACRRRLKHIGWQEIAFHCGIDVFSFRVDAHGFTLVCAARPDVPDDAAVYAAWECRHAGTPRVGEIEIPGMLERVAKRMRDISSLAGTIKQRFMQWYNAEYETSGSIWVGRFRSLILSVGDSVGGILRRFRRELFPAKRSDDSTWKDVVEVASKALGALLKRMFGGPILGHI